MRITRKQPAAFPGFMSAKSCTTFSRAGIVGLLPLAQNTEMLLHLRAGFTGVCLGFVLSACGGGNQSASMTSMDPPGSVSPPPSDATDYSVTAHWVCRPGSDTVCTTGLDALVQFADGSTQTQAFTQAADPAIDCFYVYPTVSAEQTPYADLADSPEIQAVTREQAGRLSSRCRVFAPIYRQETSYGLNRQCIVFQTIPCSMCRVRGNTICSTIIKGAESCSLGIARERYCCNS